VNFQKLVRMRVSVIVCTYSLRRFADSKSAVQSVLDQDYDDVEVILSVDRNRELFRRFSELYEDEARVKVILNTVPGLSGARNSGVSVSTGDVLAFLDDDAVAAKDWATRLVALHNMENVVAAGGKIVPLWPGEPARWIPGEMYWTIGCTYKGHREDLGPVRNTFGSNISFPRHVFDRVGRFKEEMGRVDEKAYTAEEMELCARALKAFPGSRVLYDPDAVVQHRIYVERQDIGYLLRRGFGDGLSKAMVKRSFETDEDVLDVERQFLRRLLTSSYPERLGKVLGGKDVRNNLAQLFVLTFLLSSIGMGYAWGKLTRR